MNCAAALKRTERENLDLEQGSRSVIEHVIGRAGELLDGLGRPGADVAAVRVGLPSPVGQSTGLALNPVGMHCWIDEDVLAQIGEVFEGPVHMDNDENLMTSYS